VPGRPTKDRSSERGFALAATVFALVLIGALIAGVFFAARQSLRLGENVQSAQRAFDAAEAGLHSALADWDPAVYDALAPGRSAAFAGRLGGATGSYEGVVVRLNRDLFLIRSVGRDAAGQAQRAAGGLVRLAPVSLDFGAALTVGGPLVVGGASRVEGADRAPAGWDCPPPGPTASGVAVLDAGAVTESGCGGGACLDGDPPVQVETASRASAAAAAADSAWLALAAHAAKAYDGDDEVITPRPVGSAVACDSSARDNWGDPAVPASVAGCRLYYPIILARGNLEISGGTGQGILLVAGDLQVDGGFTFYGPVLVRGKLSLVNGGGRFLGGVRASAAALQPSGAGTAEVSHSDCALTNALLAGAPATPLAARWWAQLF